MAQNEKRGKATFLSAEKRKMLGTAIIDGLVSPQDLSAIGRLNSGGGDYDQNGGGYTQSGGGNHDQGGGGGYNQSALSGNIGDLDVTRIEELIQTIQNFKR